MARSWNRQHRRRFLQGGLVLAGLSLLSGCGLLPSQARQPAKTPRLGVVSNGSASGSATQIEAFRRGLHELGYVAGQTIAIEERYADGKEAGLPALVAELMSLKVDIIFTTGTPTAQAA